MSDCTTSPDEVYGSCTSTQARSERETCGTRMGHANGNIFAQIWNRHISRSRFRGEVIEAVEIDSLLKSSASIRQWGVFGDPKFNHQFLKALLELLSKELGKLEVADVPFMKISKLVQVLLAVPIAVFYVSVKACPPMKRTTCSQDVGQSNAVSKWSPNSTRFDGTALKSVESLRPEITPISPRPPNKVVWISEPHA